MKKWKYEELDKHFTEPNILQLNVIKIPRKLKKEVKKFCSVHWINLTNSQRIWYYFEKSNPNYKLYLIKKICYYDKLQIIR